MGRATGQGLGTRCFSPRLKNSSWEGFHAAGRPQEHTCPAAVRPVRCHPYGDTACPKTQEPTHVDQSVSSHPARPARIGVRDCPGRGLCVPQSDLIQEGHRTVSRCTRRETRRDSTRGVILLALETLQKPQAKHTSCCPLPWPPGSQSWESRGPRVPLQGGRLEGPSPSCVLR